MAAAAKQRPATEAQAYYTTSYALGTGTTSTLALEIWRALSDHLTNQGKPMTFAELHAITAVTLERLDTIFGQAYFQRYYGFRRFDSLDEWTTWAEGNGVLYVPGLHDVPEEEEPILEEDEADEQEAQ